MNIVIADDEQIILKWLKKNIESLSPEYHVVEACNNGEQALNCCLNQEVDILFTDIRMPIMDGMELLKKLNENKLAPYVVILSAYDDFSYVRDAFKLGASEFLLKPEITTKGLSECLQLAAVRLRKQEDHQPAKAKAQQPLEDLLLEFFENPDAVSEDTLQQYWQDYCAIGQKDFMVLILRVFEQVATFEQIEEIIGFVFQEDQLQYHMIRRKEQELVLVSELADNGPRLFGFKLYNAFASFGLTGVTVSTSDAGHSSGEFKAVYQQAESVFQTQYFYAQTGRLDYATMQSEQERAKVKLEQSCDAISETLKAHRWQEIQPQIQQLWLLTEEIQPSVADLRRNLLNLLLSIFWNYMKEENRMRVSSDVLFKLSNLPSFHQLRDAFEEQIEEFTNTLVEEENRHAYGAAVSKIITYIEGNYAESISLEDLSSYVHLNRSYLSSLFKKETGENIYDYLQRFRLEKAKELLVSQRGSIQQIASQVGISDPAYFSKLFKKHVGQTPMEYRKSTK